MASRALFSESAKIDVRDLLPAPRAHPGLEKLLGESAYDVVGAEEAVHWRTTVAA